MVRNFTKTGRPLEIAGLVVRRADFPAVYAILEGHYEKGFEHDTDNGAQADNDFRRDRACN